MGFEKILDVYYLWLDPEERRQSYIKKTKYDFNLKSCFYL